MKKTAKVRQRRRAELLSVTRGMAPPTYDPTPKNRAQRREAARHLARTKRREPV